jgi:uncharacterized protein
MDQSMWIIAKTFRLAFASTVAPDCGQTARKGTGAEFLIASFSGYGKTIKLHSGDALVVHRPQDSRVAILEYEVHGRILSSGASYDNRFISVATIENRKIVRWRDYMDSLAAWTVLNSP